MIDVDPAGWPAGLAEDLRDFRQRAEHDQIAVELVQTSSLVPLGRESLNEKLDLGAS